MEKKTVRIKLIGFWTGFEPSTHIFFRCLEKRYHVEYVEKDPEYIVCSVFGTPYEYCEYPQVRIMLTGEPYVPDFNLVDYAISTYPIRYLDRSFRLPECFGDDMCDPFLLGKKDRNYGADILRRKPFFANFIVGHKAEYGIREKFFEELSKYKRVESCGTLLNNMPDGKTVTRANDSKLLFQRKTKFTLCFESTKHEGFISEKILNAFDADTIPVYYGSSDVTDIFNEKAFINCPDTDSFAVAIQRIIELDQNDDLYLEMLRQPIFKNPDYLDDLLSRFEQFVYNIFDQPVEEAYRRCRVWTPQSYNDYLAEAAKKQQLRGRIGQKMQEGWATPVRRFVKQTLGDDRYDRLRKKLIP